MSTERYAQVRRLFLAACELAESELGGFLDHGNHIRDHSVVVPALVSRNEQAQSFETAAPSSP